MAPQFSDELSTRTISTVFGMCVGAAAGWFFAWWRRHREKVNIFAGIAHDTVVIQHHVVESEPDSKLPNGRRATTLRVRTLGQAELKRVVPNTHLAGVLSHRAAKVTTTTPLISMAGAEGSFLLETLTGFCGDRLSLAPFDHELYVMAPCCESQEFVEHKPVVILLVAVKDLVFFEHWPSCREIQVEHGSDGSRVMTLMILARKFREEQANIAKMRREGQRTAHMETMYILDLPLDRRVAAIPLKAVPWSRFEKVLKLMGLE
jgi:hypothetical protein